MTRCPACGGSGQEPVDPLEAVTAAMRAACKAERHSVTWDDRVREVAAAWLLDRAVGTLANWRSQLKGPAYVERNGNVLYLLADIARYQSEK